MSRVRCGAIVFAGARRPGLPPPATGAVPTALSPAIHPRQRFRTVTGNDSYPRYRDPRTHGPGFTGSATGKCSLPGCAISPVLETSDHASSWPDGPTSPANLIACAGRHHRLKKSPGWTVAHPSRPDRDLDRPGRSPTRAIRSDHHLASPDDWKSLPDNAKPAAPGRDATIRTPAASNEREISPLKHNYRSFAARAAARTGRILATAGRPPVQAEGSATADEEAEWRIPP